MSKDNNQKEYEHYVEVPHTPPPPPRPPTQAYLPTQNQLEEWQRIRQGLITTLCYVENMSNNNNQNQHEHHVQVPPPPPRPRKKYPKQEEMPDIEWFPCVCGVLLIMLVLVIIAFACYGVIRMVRGANN